MLITQQNKHSAGRKQEKPKLQKHTDYVLTFWEIINLGYKPNGFENFDLRAWDKEKIDCAVKEIPPNKKSSVKNHPIQHETIKAIYKEDEELGFSSVSFMEIEIERDLPVGRREPVPYCATEILGCPWRVLSARRYPSPHNRGEVIRTDFE